MHIPVMLSRFFRKTPPFCREAETPFFWLTTSPGPAIRLVPVKSLEFKHHHLLLCHRIILSMTLFCGVGFRDFFDCSLPYPMGIWNYQKKAAVCPDLSKVFDNIFSKQGGNIMNTDQKNPEPMSEDQLEYVKKQINLTYLFLISYTDHDPKVVEVMKLSALANVQRRYEAGEPW
jgi:hypothetical protein